MIELQFSKFIQCGMICGVGVLVLDIIWVIIRGVWSWIDDCGLKLKSIGHFFWVDIVKIKTWDVGDDPFPWLGLFTLSIAGSILLWIALSFYYISLIFVVLFLLSHVARWIRRLTKRFNLHEKDKEAHKGE